MISKDRCFVGYDIDLDAVSFVKNRLASVTGDFEIIHADFYDLLKKSKLPESFAFVSNMPFNLGSRVLFDMAIYYPNTYFNIILQKEVVQKTRKDKSFTLFGAWIRLWWKTTIGFSISPGNFRPHPKVYSANMTGTPCIDIIKKYNSIEKRKKLLLILKSLFANPKKTLSNNLKNLKWSKEKIDKFYDKNSLDNNLRLSWQNYEELLDIIYSEECSRNK